MNAVPPATLCLFAEGDRVGDVRRLLDCIFSDPVLPPVCLRLGFRQAALSKHYALGRLCPDGCTPERITLPGPVERYSWQTEAGASVHLWDAPGSGEKDQVARCLFHDVPPDTDYLIWLDEVTLEAGWWQKLTPLLEQRFDWIGSMTWLEYAPGQLERIQQQPWYRGALPARRSGKPGVLFPRDGFLALRSACLKETIFPPPTRQGATSADPPTSWGLLLGEILHQLGWTRADWSCFDVQT